MNSRFRLIWLLFFTLPLYAGFAGGRTARPALITEKDPSPEPGSLAASPHESAAGSWSGDSVPGEAITQAALSPPERIPGGPSPGRAEEVMRAFARAYPDRVADPEFLDGDWTVKVYGERFYFSEGRMLPGTLRDQVSEYDPQPFYNYQKELPPWEPPGPEESARMKEQMARRMERQAKRSQHFGDTLWRIRNRDESWDRVKQIRFLGHPVMVHYSILVELSLVEEHILKAAKTSAEVRNWISSIGSIEGWNWRNIASTQSRSYHSYGAAVDLLPKSYGGRETYWLWTARYIPEWWTVPYTKRFHPPEEVIRAFESFGFIWGGKWRYFDTMHFEYRPELLVLGGIDRVNHADLRPENLP